MTKDTGATGRDLLLAYVRRQLVGPADGETELIPDLPSSRYAAGVLFPVGTEFADSSASEASDVDDPIAQATKYYPSAAGLSLLLAGPGPIEVGVRAARYAPEESADGPGARGTAGDAWTRWRRVPITGDGEETVAMSIAAPFHRTFPVLDGRGRLDVVGRATSAGIIVTVALANAVRATDLRGPGRGDRPSRRAIAQSCLFQVEVLVRPGGLVAAYPPAGAGLADDEDLELAFVHRDRPVFAVGHGLAADWQAGPDGLVLRTDALPTAAVPSIRFEGPRTRHLHDSLRLRSLADAEDPASLLEPLALTYETWVDAQRKALSGERLPPAAEGVGRRLIERQERAARRIREGIETLRSSATSREAFRLANRILADQMQRPALGASAAKVPRWRPFQLAFALTVIPSLADAAHPDRGVVDLLWFPTGGGKTEAYLFIAAFEIIRRRLGSGGTDDGLVVLSRYTLRLLTTQQFQRTAAMGCAAELVRREDEVRLGSKPIRVGLWVGRDHSPNTYGEARDTWLPRWSRGEALLPVPDCPWCGTQLVDPKSADHRIQAGAGIFEIACRSRSCPFGDPGPLPVQIVDDAIYEQKPSMVIGTVDKLALLPTWTADRVGLLGGPGRRGPSLVLQDELHLLNGPLGTIAALYEIGVDAVITAGGIRPKVIASTATIRRAVSQSRSLFGRDLALFPPNGIHPDDSFFSETDPDPRRARMYVGAMTVGTSWQSTAVYALTALASGVTTLPEEEQDPYWTSVVYANTLDDHGRVATLVADDVRARLRQLAPAEDAVRPLDEVAELRGAGDTGTLIDILSRLARPRGTPGALDCVITTNLIQVGIDIQRLGLIVFVGQPKSTSEYIQASSRVGRDGDAPGLIVTLFNHGRARDRSHYESFTSFHSSLYRWVEPMSITPFSVAALDRLLPAVAAIVARHATTTDMQPSIAAGAFRSESPAADAVRTRVAERADLSDPGDQAEARVHVERRIRQWDEAAAIARDAREGLVYAGGGKEHRRLLRVFGGEHGLWEIQTSMRSVEEDVKMTLWAPSGDRRT